MIFFKYVVMLLGILVGVAFYTLMERKVLGYSHNRFGPNKLGIWGILQPFSDALKLFSKEMFKMKNINLFFFMFSPMLSIFFMVLLWGILPIWGNLFSSKFTMIIFFCVMSMNLYPLLFSGWGSSSKYSIFGSYRSSAQSLSYEIPMIFLMVSIFFLNFSLSSISLISEKSTIIFMTLSLLPIWFMCCLAESNRSPFDFTEGESELVSGFNTEYMGGYFSLIFIAEYGSILFISLLTIIFFVGNQWSMYFFFFIIIYSFLWVRTSFPRLRYDFLMLMAWKSLVLVSTLVFMILFFFTSL